MEFKAKNFWFFNLAAAVLLFFSTDAYAEVKAGWLIDISATDRKITIDENLGFPEKKYMTYTIVDDANWHVCLERLCLREKGAAGYSKFKELAKEYAYGVPYRSFRVLLNVNGDKATGVEIQITTKMH